MLALDCPYCGNRAQTEFTFGGDASIERPSDPRAVPLTEWLDYVYLRANPRGPHTEWWQHSAGCRRWFKVRRDTLTHEVIGSSRPAENPLESPPDKSPPDGGPQ